MNWDFLDNNCEIWCINLKYRTDRYEHAIQQFKNINILDKVNFYHPEKSNHKITQKGCWDSHKYCMKKALDNNKNILIFEDDVLFDNNIIKQYENIKKFYKKDNWDILRLGYIAFQYDKQIEINLWEGKFIACHAYFISNEYINKCINNKYFDAELYKFPGIDDYYRIESNNDYCIIPQIAWQYNSKSDNKWLSLNFGQDIFENKYLFSFNQKTINIISWYLRYFPNFIKILNPYNIMFFISDYINLVYDNIKNKFI